MKYVASVGIAQIAAHAYAATDIKPVGVGYVGLALDRSSGKDKCGGDGEKMAFHCLGEGSEEGR